MVRRSTTVVDVLRRSRLVAAAIAAAAVAGGVYVLAPRVRRPASSAAPDPAAVAAAAARAAADDSARVARERADSARADSVRVAAAADSARRARADSIRAMRDPRVVRAAALRATDFRLLVSLSERRLFVLEGSDTVRVAPVGIGMDSTIVYQGRVWRFQTPRGIRRVLGKESDPVWVPPEWHYVEVARARDLRLVRLRANRPVTLDDSSQILVQDGDVGLVRPGQPFTPFATDQEVIWEGTLYIPPVGTRQRQITGELGRYRLNLGEGYLLHGTPHAESIGEPSSHGCMRLGDDDIEWLYDNVPVGTAVYTY